MKYHNFSGQKTLKIKKFHFKNIPAFSRAIFISRKIINFNFSKKKGKELWISNFENA